MEGICACGLQFTLEQHEFELLARVHLYVGFCSKYIGNFFGDFNNLKKCADNYIA